MNTARTEGISLFYIGLASYIQAVYFKDVDNSGTFYSFKDFQYVLATWTEKNLLDHIEQGEW